MVRTQSRPYGPCHCPYTKVHIKGFGSSYLHVYACLLLCFMLVLASLVLGFAMFGALCRLDLVWLHPMPIRPCLYVTIWEASPNAVLPHAYPSLFRFVWCYAYHICSHNTLAFYASLHVCLHVHAWVLLASVSSMLQHNEVMDIRSKPTLVPHEHHLLFCFLLVCLHACLLAYLLYASFICSLHLFLPFLVCWFIVFAFTCTHMEWKRMELRHGLPSVSKKGKDEGLWI